MIQTIGSFEVFAAVDDDGHLTIQVRSLDGTAVVEVDEDVAQDDHSFGVRLTSEGIESTHLAK